MVEETGNSMNMQPAEEEYEYEYIELAEGGRTSGGGQNMNTNMLKFPQRKF